MGDTAPHSVTDGERRAHALLETFDAWADVLRSGSEQPAVAAGPTATPGPATPSAAAAPADGLAPVPRPVDLAGRVGVDATPLTRPVLRASMALLHVIDDGRETGETVRMRGDRLVIGRHEGDVVVPHDLLFHLPFHALHDGQRYLLERFEVVYLPVASLLGQWSGQRPRRALIVGHDHDGRLPAALKEAQTIYEILAAAADKTGIVPHLLLSEDATEARLRQHTPDCGVLHLATHGVFRQDNPLFSALRLADNWLTLADVERLALPQAPLVTLSACETGLGDLRRGDIFGLSQAFMQAGAASLVVSLWPVPDESTRQLMIHFYRSLVAGKSKAAALRSAQLTLRSDPAYGHPLHWAGFVLIGDGGVLWWDGLTASEREKSVDGQSV